ncbi:MAG: hypothetical protein AB3N16_07305 [Flavobacteriaceae bacterium]
MKKTTRILGIFALTFILFSFKPSDSNEHNLGNVTILDQTTQFVHHNNIHSSSRVVTNGPKEAVKRVVNGAKRVWDQRGKSMINELARVAYSLFKNPNWELGHKNYTAQRDFKLSQL